jgi:hypothetical protein
MCALQFASQANKTNWQRYQWWGNHRKN